MQTKNAVAQLEHVHKEETEKSDYYSNHVHEHQHYFFFKKNKEGEHTKKKLEIKIKHKGLQNEEIYFTLLPTIELQFAVFHAEQQLPKIDATLADRC